MNFKFGFQVGLFTQATRLTTTLNLHENPIGYKEPFPSSHALACLTTTLNLHKNPISYKEPFPSSHTLAYLVRAENSFLVSKAKTAEAQYVMHFIHGYPA